MGGDLAPNLGDQKNFRAQFQEKFPFSGYKYLMTFYFFLVIDLILRIFPFFSHIFRMFTMLNVVYDHFLTKNTLFPSVHAFTHIRQPYFSKYWGGPMHGRSPTSNFWGDRPPSPPRSSPLRHSILA